jgi:uncharacterized protein (TIGR03437 family)
MATGAIRANGSGQAPLSERVRLGQSPIDFSGVNSYAVNADSTGALAGILVEDVTNFAIGAPSGDRPAAFVQAQIDAVDAATQDHGLAFGVRMPDLTGSGVFLSPLGVLNGASFAPPTYPISGGTILSLFGTGLAPSEQSAQSVPLPTTLAGVSVTINDVPAPLFFVSPGQINLQTPFSITGATARIVVNNNSNLSTAVDVPVAATSPGIFSRDQNGIGPAVITHADFSLVTTQDPALPGETIIIFLTGLGAVDPPFADGAPGPSSPLSVVTDQDLQVEFGREVGTILFAGAAPGFVGLYQINVTIPDTVVVGTAVPVAIQTTNGFTDLVDLAIGL